MGRAAGASCRRERQEWGGVRGLHRMAQGEWWFRGPEARGLWGGGGGGGGTMQISADTDKIYVSMTRIGPLGSRG